MKDPLSSCACEKKAWKNIQAWTGIERMKDQIDERSSQLLRNLSSCEKKAWKNSGLKGIRTHDFCDAGAVLYQLSYQANWELVILWVRNIPVKERTKMSRRWASGNKNVHGTLLDHFYLAS